MGRHRKRIGHFGRQNPVVGQGNPHRNGLCGIVHRRHARRNALDDFHFGQQSAVAVTPPLVRDEISQRVEDGTRRILLEGLHDVRMTADDQIRTVPSQEPCQHPLFAVRPAFVLVAPMHEGDNAIDRTAVDGRQIAGDGEGATRLLECCVTGAADHGTAKTVAKSIICSSLVKAAMFGADANWGRVLCAIGYSGAPVNVHKVDVAFRSAAGTVRVCVDGAGIPFSEEEAKKVLLEKEIEILVDLKSGDEGATAWGCDLTYDYVKINGDYRT
mgnify:FL=1